MLLKKYLPYLNTLLILAGLFSGTAVYAQGFSQGATQNSEAQTFNLAEGTHNLTIELAEQFQSPQFTPIVSLKDERAVDIVDYEPSGNNTVRVQVKNYKPQNITLYTIAVKD